MCFKTVNPDKQTKFPKSKFRWKVLELDHWNKSKPIFESPYAGNLWTVGEVFDSSKQPALNPDRLGIKNRQLQVEDRGVHVFTNFKDAKSWLDVTYRRYRSPLLTIVKVRVDGFIASGVTQTRSVNSIMPTKTVSAICESETWKCATIVRGSIAYQGVYKRKIRL